MRGPTRPPCPALRDAKVDAGTEIETGRFVTIREGDL